MIQRLIRFIVRVSRDEIEWIEDRAQRELNSRNGQKTQSYSEYVNSFNERQ